jgi:hypothetical protein
MPAGPLLGRALIEGKIRPLSANFSPSPPLSLQIYTKLELEGSAGGGGGAPDRVAGPWETDSDSESPERDRGRDLLAGVLSAARGAQHTRPVARAGPARARPVRGP